MTIPSIPAPMATIRFFVLLISLSLLLSFPGAAQQVVLTQSNASGIYKIGDIIRLNVSCPQAKAGSLVVRIRKNYHPEIQSQKRLYTGADMLLFEETAAEPGSFIFEVWSASDTASIGCIIAPENIRPFTADQAAIRRFWDNEKLYLRAQRLLVKNNPVPMQDSGFACFDTELNCTGPRPARGYFAKPITAAPHSLPIVLYLHAAGVKGSWCLSEPGIAMRYAKIGKGALAFDLNAHGMLNGQPPAYYDSLEKTVLKDYAFQGIDDVNDMYFRGMYLRMVRTLDYLCSQPEWDGKRIMVIGESQGGGQALVAAGLDNRVDLAVAIVPAMCDWGATLSGSKGGWPDPLSRSADAPKTMNTMAYFDAAQLLVHSRASLLVEIGLIDITCPSASIYAALSQASGKKMIYTVPYRAHHLTQTAYKKEWETGVYQPRENFIKAYLQ